MKTLVLSLGNPILGDDGVGFRVIEALKKHPKNKETTLESAALGGLNMVEILSGYERAIIIDAIKAGGRVGQIYRLTPDSLRSTSHSSNPHDLNFTAALELGKKLKVILPQRIDILAIEIPDATSFSEKCTPEVAKAIPACVRMVLRLLKEQEK